MDEKYDDRPTTENQTRIKGVFDSLANLSSLSFEAHNKAHDIKIRLIGAKPPVKGDQSEKATKPSNHFDKLDRSISFISETIRETNDILNDIMKEI